jgi:GntR family transcriptional regulator
VADGGGGAVSRPDGPETIAIDLLRRIRQGEFPAGTRLPSEADLAESYQVTRGRVRTALAGLARRGLIVSRRNAGWLVQAEHQTQSLDRMRSFSQWAWDHDRVPTGVTLRRERRPADAREAKLLRIKLGDPVSVFVRLRSLDGRKVMVERSTWAPWVAPLIDALPDDAPSTTRALAEAGIDVVVGQHRIEAVAAGSQDAEWLGVRRSSPLLQVERITETQSGRLVEIGVDRYLPGVIAFEVRSGEPMRRSPGTASG